MPRDLDTVSPLDAAPWVADLSGGFDVVVDVTDGAAPVLRLRGELDLAGVGMLEGPAFRLLSEHGAREVVLDLSELDFIDVSGVNALLGLDRAAARLGGRLVLRGAGPQARQVLQATRAASVLRLDPVGRYD